MQIPACLKKRIKTNYKSKSQLQKTTKTKVQGKYGNFSQ